jgi:hypothetical protein
MSTSDFPRTAVGVGFNAIAEEHIFTFLLSSPFTSRTIVRERMQVDEVKRDLELALLLSIAWSLVMGVLLHDWMSTAFGILFGLLLYYVYAVRAGFL